MKISSLASIIAATLSAGGAIGGYFFFKPRDLESYLKWKGFDLVSIKDSENLWKSIYVENKASFSSDFNSVDSSNAWNVIKKYCTDVLKKKDYYSHIEKASKWCQSKVRTVKGQMVKEGLDISNLMTNHEEFKLASAFQGNLEFWNLIDAEDNTLKKRAEAYEKWCKNSLELNPNKNLVKNVDTFCHRKKYTNFKTKLANDGYERISGNNKIDEKYDELKLSELEKYKGSKSLEILGGGSGSWKEKFGIEKNNWKITKEKFREVFEAYCKSLDENKFEEENYLDSYSTYRGICSKNISKKV